MTTGGDEQARCPRCGAGFRCTPAGRCWCMDLPPAGLPVAAGAGCLCPACLAAAAGASTGPTPRPRNLPDRT
ncbi:cysteine-rich CWC family protein [Paracraurococcus lichenis]|uniref:cysteine-rich CWC family protein n=1 Tax=Paracraurococcus lichenis TaxID=3064888 RepID=UPI00351D5E9D